MRVHHLNCATMCPPARTLINGDGGLHEPGRLVCHCLLVETRDGLVLVDTGLGTADLADPHGRLGLPFQLATRPALDPAEPAIAQVRRLGFAPADVRHVVATHLDVDHAGGIADFPQAEIHVGAAELDAAMRPASLFERHRYRKAHWAHGPRWAPRPPGGERWHGFEGVQELLPGEPGILLVPLAGHSRGHCGVAVRRAEGWLLHAGDAYYHHAEMASPPFCPPLLNLFQVLGQADAAQRVANQARLRTLVAAGEVEVVCAHDATEYARHVAGS